VGDDRWRFSLVVEVLERGRLRSARDEGNGVMRETSEQIAARATLIKTAEGRAVTVGRRAATKRVVTVGREWRVEVDGVHVGDISYDMVTRERRTPGRTYVNARWESPGWRHRDPGDFARWFEGHGKADCIERLVRDNLTVSAE
jgi:hypothetical protein